ncbi:cell adhesion molecule Dscam2-like [Cydia strobilella]|uniref:cell adhesion molecule Dscam2-like n=1 Tax=Cydia strobilella TaxID=1100964 RepID=UPI003004BE4A
MGFLSINMTLMRRDAGATLQLLFVVLLFTSYHGAAEEREEQTESSEPRLAPWFTSEPPSRAVFASSAGARLMCAARGEPPPAITWTTEDGQELLSDQHRRVYNNGSLEIAPTPTGTSVGGNGVSVVRCRASNTHGVALSAPVTLLPVADDSWEAAVTVWPAAVGGVAMLTCGVAGLSSTGDEDEGDELEVALWYHGERVIDVPPPTPETRYLSAGNTLLIRSVTERDAGTYGCLARHRATRRSRRARSAELRVSRGATGAVPAPAAAARTIRAAAGAAACLPCATSLHPGPHYTWYREREGRLQPVAGEGDTWTWAGGAALCLRAARMAAGAWLCKAYSALGDATARLRLLVDVPLTMSLHPQLVVAASGSTVRLNCSASDEEATLSWRHDGAPVAGAGGAGTASLLLRGVTRAARGVYQCEARRGTRAAQASAELRLGESAPELQYTFIEQALRAGGDVALRCAAAAAPPPRIAWLLDAQPLAHYRAPHRYTVTEETGAGGEIVSVLRLRALSAADGGRYTCHAHNSRGAAEHSARLNVYGPPSIRAAGPVRVVAGANATIYCPYAGYPISEVWWWRDGERIGGVGRVSARSAALRLRPALPADQAAYACSVTTPDGQVAKREIEIQVRNPPKISPFIFSAELTEGSSAQALCGVSSGDKPLYFSWLKDGVPLPAALQVQEKSLGEFSLLVFPALAARHSGVYTCRVANHAASANYSATLSVKVAPSWTSEPSDAAVLLGAPLLLECAARGHPTPVVTWFRKVGESANGLENEEQWEEVSGGQWGDPGGAAARGGALSAAAAARRHQGRYRCKVDNGVGAPLLKHVNVTVHEPAHFEATEPRNVSAVRGREAVLWCRARGDAPLSLTWTRLGRRLDLDSFRWSISESGAGGAGEALRSELRLRAAEGADAGEYRCLAANHYGRAEMIVFLHVEEPPEAPAGLRLGGVGARWIRLVWDASSTDARYSVIYTPLHAPPGSAVLTVNLTIVTAPLEAEIPSGALSAILSGLRPAAAYSLRAVAANHVGASPPSAPLLFTTLEEAPSSSPQDARVRAVAPGELLVSWTAPSRDSWNGELLGYVVTWRALSGADDDEESEGEEGAARAGSAAIAGWARAELTLRGLHRYARYAVSLRAYNRAGAGPPAPPVYASTADGVPLEAVGGVRCAAEAGALRVWWSPPAPPAPPPAPALTGYDVHYAPQYDSPAWTGPAGGGVAAAASGASGATLRQLRPATNYSVWVRARTGSGPGPPSTTVTCSTLDDVPGAIRSVRALASSTSTVRVSWRAPPRTRISHFTLYTKERDKVGGEWSQRVEPDEDLEEEGEAWHEVRGLRERVLYEFWVRAHNAAGSGEPGRVATAAPASNAPVRVLSWPRTIREIRGTRVRLRCVVAGGGSGPIRRRWAPLPRRHTVTAAGDLLIHELEAESSGNYTCLVSGADGSSDIATWRVDLRTPPAAPLAPRLLRADHHVMLVAWDAAPAHVETEPILGYTVWWTREVATGGKSRSARVPAGASAAGYSRALRGLACGARHKVWLRAHSLAGVSGPSTPLLAATTGRQAGAPPGAAFIWANSTSLRLNLLIWRAGGAGGELPCPVARWSVALRPAAGGGWSALPEDGETAEAGGLAPGAWYEVRVAAHGAAAVTRARYRAATRARSGERIGDPVELAVEEGASPAGVEGVPSGDTEARTWRGGLAPALAAGALAALLGAGAAALLRARRASTPPPVRPAHPHPQLYTTEPGKRNGKTLTPPNGELEEISPYATFSMGGGATNTGTTGTTGARGGCALHLHTFGRASPLAMAAPPSRPNLLHHAPEFGVCSSDSESSGSPCAACAETYRVPAGARHTPHAHTRSHSESVCGVESSADDTSYSASGRGERAVRGERGARGRRRRDHAPAVRSGEGMRGRGGDSSAYARRDAL